MAAAQGTRGDHPTSPAPHVLGPHFTVRSSELFGVWSAWCPREGEEPGTNKAFTEALQGRGYDTRRTNIGAVWRGIGLAAGDGAE